MLSEGIAPVNSKSLRRAKRNHLLNIYTAPPALQLAAALPAGARTALRRLAALCSIAAPPLLQLAAALPAGARTALRRFAALRSIAAPPALQLAAALLAGARKALRRLAALCFITVFRVVKRQSEPRFGVRAC